MLTAQDLAELTRKLWHNEMPVWRSTPEILQTFQRISQGILDWNQPYTVSRMIINLNQLLIAILGALTAQQTGENPELTSRRRTVELFLKDLAENPVSTQELWMLDQMAKQCGMGVTAFSKYARELVNTGPMEFLNHCRLDRAAKQLRVMRRIPRSTQSMVGGRSTPASATRQTITHLSRKPVNPRLSAIAKAE